MSFTIILYLHIPVCISTEIGKEQQISVFDGNKIADLSKKEKRTHCFVTDPNLSACCSCGLSWLQYILQFLLVSD